MQVEPLDVSHNSKLADKIADLRQALETMMQRIETGEDIMEQLEQIDLLHQNLEPSAPKMLQHYLERKSYTKALALLKDL
jgi:uncharacterized coiled-coil DUF342 family protein